MILIVKHCRTNDICLQYLITTETPQRFHLFSPGVVESCSGLYAAFLKDFKRHSSELISTVWYSANKCTGN